MIKLGFNLGEVDINSQQILVKIDELFSEFLKQELVELKANPLISLAPFVDDFLSKLFCIEQEVYSQRASHKEFDLLYECKRRFVQRYAVKKYSKEALKDFDFASISAKLVNILDAPITEKLFAEKSLFWLDNPEKHQAELEIAAVYAAFMVNIRSRVTIFSLPQKIDPQNLINQENLTDNVRLGFDYKDPDLNLNKALNEAHYCIYCHNQSKDSCSKGLNDQLNGCPLEQKISEMNYAKSQGFNLAALAIITLDNPLVAATGHRICNDCMKACIYQKQDPVNIPIVESNILESVLELPYGAEIYLLLTRWNPFLGKASLPKDNTGYNVLVAGLGPAGIAISHYLLQEGHNVVAIDGLKISELPFRYDRPIKNWAERKQSLAKRIPLGFGGVAEYGITARWDKNNLTLLRLVLERRENFKLYGAVALDKNLTKEQAFNMGFHHIAICTGAGSPKILEDNSFCVKGVITASDFLMTLQAGGAFLENSLANLTIRLPARVIGGGLTAIDAATEVLSYYPLQVKRFLERYEKLVEEIGAKKAQENWSEEDKLVAGEFISHAKLFSECSSKEELKKVLNDLGGVTIYYRGNQINSPAYRLNHEEINHALAAGVNFKYDMTPVGAKVDKFGHVSEVEFNNGIEQAKTVILAIGTNHQDYVQVKRVSYFGDCANDSSASSVVKAIASSKKGYRKITNQLTEQPPSNLKNPDDCLISTIKKINHLTDNIIELIIHSPLAVQNFKPGQFFRLQNYTSSPEEMLEPLALTGAYVEGNNISLIVLKSGLSSKLCWNFKEGERVALMGPAGTPTTIFKNKNVMLIGGGLGNVTLLSISKALKNNGCRVVYIAGYKNLKDRFYPEKIETYADRVIWCCEKDVLPIHRAKDLSIKGTVIDGIKAFNDEIKIDEIICAGSSGMMAAVAESKYLFKGRVNITCSVNSLMQCMQGVCGQCLQKTTDGKHIFSCIAQDQDSGLIDFKNLQDRQKQNSLQQDLCIYSANLNN